MFVRDSSAAAELPALSAQLPKLGERRTAKIVTKCPLDKSAAFNWMI
jgi:hypothetical protein